MADNEQINDDYQFTEIDPLNPSSYEEPQVEAGEKTPVKSKFPSFIGDSSVKQKAILVVIIFIGLSIGYKFFGAYLGLKNVNKDEIEATPPAPIEAPVPTPIPKPAVTQENIAPKANPEPISDVSQNQEMSQKISNLSAGQEVIRTDISALSSQVASINTNLQDLAKKIENMNGLLTSMNEKLDIINQEIVKVQPKPRVERIVRPRVPYTPVIVSKYYIQAVIPGRAWLVSTQGNTITVREGSIVPGYGRVTLIDPNQGRVLTTSGKIIKFSQQDS